MTSSSAIGSYAYPTQGPGVVRPHAVTQAGAFTLQYDAMLEACLRHDGNMTSKLGPGASLTMVWNAENKLGTMKVGAADYYYRYTAWPSDGPPSAGRPRAEDRGRRDGPGPDHGLPRPRRRGLSRT